MKCWESGIDRNVEDIVGVDDINNNRIDLKKENGSKNANDGVVEYSYTKSVEVQTRRHKRFKSTVEKQFELVNFIKSIADKANIDNKLKVWKK